jgi:hypothetical protein
MKNVVQFLRGDVLTPVIYSAINVPILKADS